MPSRASTSLLQGAPSDGRRMCRAGVNALTGFNLIATWKNRMVLRKRTEVSMPSRASTSLLPGLPVPNQKGSKVSMPSRASTLLLPKFYDNLCRGGNIIVSMPSRASTSLLQ